MLPNDNREQDVWTFSHRVFRLTLGGALCRTKLDSDSPQKILDIGTGTEIWAIES